MNEGPCDQGLPFLMDRPRDRLSSPGGIAGVRLLLVTLPIPCVVVYTVGRECPLCDEARAHLDAVARSRPLDLRVVVVDADPRLAIRHALRVPVIEIDGVEVLHGKVTRSEIEAALDRTRVVPPA